MLDDTSQTLPGLNTSSGTPSSSFFGVAMMRILNGHPYGDSNSPCCHFGSARLKYDPRESLVVSSTACDTDRNQLPEGRVVTKARG